MTDFDLVVSVTRGVRLLRRRLPRLYTGVQLLLGAAVLGQGVGALRSTFAFGSCPLTVPQICLLGLGAISLALCMKMTRFSVLDLVVASVHIMNIYMVSSDLVFYWSIVGSCG